MGGHTTSWLGSLPVTIQHQPQLGLLQQTDEPVQACDAQIRPTRRWEEGQVGWDAKIPTPPKEHQCSMAIRLATHYLLGPVWPRDRIDIYSRGNRNCTDTTEQLSFSSHSAQRCIPKHPLGCTSQEHVAIICACTQAPGFPLQKASVTSAFQYSLMRACVQITSIPQETSLAES